MKNLTDYINEQLVNEDGFFTTVVTKMLDIFGDSVKELIKNFGSEEVKTVIKDETSYWGNDQEGLKKSMADHKIKDYTKADQMLDTVHEQYKDDKEWWKYTAKDVAVGIVNYIVKANDAKNKNELKGKGQPVLDAGFSNYETQAFIIEAGKHIAKETNDQKALDAYWNMRVASAVVNLIDQKGLAGTHCGEYIKQIRANFAKIKPESPLKFVEGKLQTGE